MRGEERARRTPAISGLFAKAMEGGQLERVDREEPDEGGGFCSARRSTEMARRGGVAVTSGVVAFDTAAKANPSRGDTNVEGFVRGCCR